MSDEKTLVPVSQTWTMLDGEGNVDLKKFHYALALIKSDCEFLMDEIEKSKGWKDGE